MYKFYIIPDATTLSSHADLYNPVNMKLFWDPYTESDVYSSNEPQWKEELNKASSVEFTVLPTNIHYNDFHKKKTVIIGMDEGEWLFEGVVTDAPIDFFKQRKVSVSSGLAYLCDSIQAPDEKNVIEVPVSNTDNKYLVVPTAWYSGADPKALDWYEQSIIATYEEVDKSDIFHSDVTYYHKVSGNYEVLSVDANSWASTLASTHIYVVNGERTEYKKTNDTSANNNKRYFYKFTGDGQNYTGNTVTSKAATKESIIDHIKRLLNVHNSQVDPFKRIFLGQVYNSNDTEKHEFKSSGYRTTWDALKSDILDEYGKYFTITIGNDHLMYLNYLELNQLPNSTNGLLEVANNIIELSEADNQDDDIFTVLVPIGKSNLTVEKVTGHDSPADANAEVSPYIASFGGNKRYVVVSKKAVKRYGYIFKSVSISDVSDASKLYDRAVKYIQNNYDFHTEYEVKAVDLKFINGSGNRIRVGDRVRVHSKWHGIDINTLYVISAEHDLVNPENDSFKIGIPTSDREANNRTLTGQSNKTKSSSSASAASAQSAIDSFAAKLAALMEIDEWGIKAHTRIENKMESADGMYMTKFLQTEYDINLVAQKVFGPTFEDDQQQDAGYIKVPKSDYKKANGMYKNPTEEIWYEYVQNDELNKKVYQRSVRDTCDPAIIGNVDFYIQRLWTRYSDINVGPGGIHATVQGNYERSTASASWIEMNEDAILALTGHIWVDEDGHVHVSSGSGMQTDHHEEKTEKRYVQVPRTMYKDAQGNLVKPGWGNGGKCWYERKPDPNNGNRWLGEGKDDAMTNDNYYKQSTDETVNYGKTYYYNSYIREEFRAELGVYDEDNLTAGILARTINNPTYHRVYLSQVEEAIANGTTLAELEWFEYDYNTGLYGVPLNTAVPPSMATYKAMAPDKNPIGYYEEITNSQTWTAVMGDHIVIGGRLDEDGNPIIYDGVSEETQARIQQYIDDRNLDGTITEIASDVLYAKAIITNYINVLSTKLFGTNNDDNDFKVIKPAGTSSDANPSKEGWYEKVKKSSVEEDNPDPADDSKWVYILSADEQAVKSKAYYVTKLTSRVTDFEVGEGGIHATVKGNYDRSIVSQAWIEANEEKLEMLLGHIGEDENGNLVIDAGAGFRTGYVQPDPVTARYVLVLRSKYSGANPNTSIWYERKIGTDGRWLGAGKQDCYTNDDYYERSSDTSSNYSKQYFEKSTTAESYHAEYGVYDQGNLAAGVIAQMVNHPKYLPIERSIQTATNPSTATTVKVKQSDGTITEIESQWYVYNSGNCSYGRTTDTTWRVGTVYRYLVTSTGTYTNLKGDHIVIGPSTTPASMDDDARQNESLNDRIARYVGEHQLNGTICEIASDVVKVNALFAKYIQTEYLESENNLLGSVWADNIYAREGMWSAGDLYINTGGKYGADQGGTRVSRALQAFANGAISYEENNIMRIPWYSLGDVIGGVQGHVDYGGYLDLPLSNSITSFGTPTYSGDDVIIPFFTLATPNTQGATAPGSITFTKPASLGNVVWSDGEVLDIYTVGGWAANPKWKFFNANLLIQKNYSGSSVSYQRKGSDFADLNFSLLNNKPTLKATLQVTGTWTGESHDEEEDDPHITAWEKPIFFDASAAYDDGHEDAKTKIGAANISKFTPGADTELNQHVVDIAQSTDYDTYYGYRATYDGSGIGDIKYFKTPADRYNTGYDDAVGTLAIDPSSDQTPDWGNSVTVTAQVTKRDGTKAETSIKVNAKSKPTISSPASATAPQGVTPTGLSYGTTYEVHLVSGSTNLGNSIYFKAPDNNATSHSIDIPNDGFDVSTSEPSGQKLTNLKNAISEAIRDKKWLYFKVKCGGTSKQYYMDFR